MPRALVIGGGVAGPAVAMFLARDGWDIHVYEAHAEPDPYAGCSSTSRRTASPCWRRSACGTGC